MYRLSSAFNPLLHNSHKPASATAVSASVKNHCDYILNWTSCKTHDSLDWQSTTEPVTLHQSFKKKKDITLMHPRFQSLMVDFRGQLNTYSAGKESSNLTRCKRFSTDLQLCCASYSLYTALQHKGEPCSFLESNSYLQLSGVKIKVSQSITFSL